TLRIMKLWHQAVKELNNIERGISEIDFSLDISPVFRVKHDADLASKLEAIPIFSERIRIVDFASRALLSDTALTEAMIKLFGQQEE
ncbi:hypothetical protein GN958_ATG06510, partial [Phytophthora infestans]